MRKSISHVTLEKLIQRGATELEALNIMSRMRTLAVQEGKAVTRVIRDGKVREQIVYE